jgi:hypothetical protein
LDESKKRKSGAQPGNQNARKHGFYSSVLKLPQQRYDVNHATQIEGLDEEISLLRVTLKSLLEHDPDNIQLMLQIVRALSRLIYANHEFSGDRQARLEQDLLNILNDNSLDSFL